MTAATGGTAQMAIDFDREQQSAAAGMQSIQERLGPATMAEIHRAFDHCRNTFPRFTAEHVYRACSAECRSILDLRTPNGKRINRNVLGSVFKARSKAREIRCVGAIPAVHAGSRGRMLIEWEPCR